MLEIRISNMIDFQFDLLKSLSLTKNSKHNYF